MQTQDSVTILLQVKEQIEGLTKVQGRLEQLEKQANSFTQALKLGLGINLQSMAMRALGYFRQIPGQLVDFAQDANQSAAAMERLQYQTAAVLMTADPKRFPDYGAALRGYTELLPTMREQARAAGVSVTQLGEVWAALAIQLEQGNVPLEKQIDLIARIVRATSMLGLSGPQLMQEARALITGEIKNSAFLGSSLGLKGEAGAKQIQEAKEQGRLYDFLADKLKGFAASAENATNGFDYLNSQLAATREQMKAAAAMSSERVAKEDIRANIALEKQSGPWRNIWVGVGNLIETQATDAKLALLGWFNRSIEALFTDPGNVLRMRMGGAGLTDAAINAIWTTRTPDIAAVISEALSQGIADAFKCPGRAKTIPALATAADSMPITDYSTAVWEDITKQEEKARKAESALWEKLIDSALGFAHPQLGGLEAQGIYLNKTSAQAAATDSANLRAVLEEVKFMSSCFRSGLRIDAQILQTVF